MPIPYDVANPDPAAARRIFLDWLKVQPTGQLDLTGSQYAHLVQWSGPRNEALLAFHLSDVFWELVVEGVVAPGSNSSNLQLPFYHVTSYGQRVLAATAGHPHDEDAYLTRVSGLVPMPDATVMAYLAEAVKTFRRGTPVAATVMLGIAAERVFLLVCDALLAALKDPNEQKTFTAILERFPMKPKLDWAHNKVQTIHARRMAGWPDTATLAVMAVYDLLRTQRNDLGHPRDLPPTLDREEAFVSLQVFPRYYQTSVVLIDFFKKNTV
jgi:hypothetical protein